MSSIIKTEILIPGPPGTGGITLATANAAYAAKAATEAAITRGIPATAGSTGQLNGVNASGDPGWVTVRGSGKTVADLSGITYFFVPPLLDIRAYGAIGNLEATERGLSAAAKRAANNTALQAAVTDSHTTGAGTRRVLIPGGDGGGGLSDAFEFDQTIQFDSRAILVTEHEEPLGARLLYYGAVNTHAFEPTAVGRSYFAASGIRLEDGRGSAAATGTGNGLHLDEVYNGTHLENCLIRGFYRNVYTRLNDMIRIFGGWHSMARNYSLYIDQPQNFNHIYDIAMETDPSYSSQAGCIYVNGSGIDNTLTIQEVKIEGGLASAHGLVINGGSNAIHVDGFSSRGQFVKPNMADVVRIQGAGGNGIAESISLDRITALTNTATNLLHIIPSDGGDYTIPAHTSQASAILHWSSRERVLSRYAKPGEGAYSWTQAATGTAAGTVVPAGGAGSGSTITIDGDDQQGSITVTTGTAPAASNQLCSVYFRVPWPRDPKAVSLTPANAATAALVTTAQVYPGDLAAGRLSRTYMRFYTGSTAISASTIYKWHYRVLP